MLPSLYARALKLHHHRALCYLSTAFLTFPYIFKDLFYLVFHLDSCLLGGPGTCAWASLSDRWTLDQQCSLYPALFPLAPDQIPWVVPVPDSSPTMSGMTDGPCHKHGALPAMFRCGGVVWWLVRALPVLGLPGAHLSLEQLALCTLTWLTGPWSGTPAIENRPWHPCIKLSCFCCSWYIYNKNITYFTSKKSCNSVLLESKICVRKGKAINGIFGEKIFCIVLPSFLWDFLCLSELLAFSS